MIDPNDLDTKRKSPSMRREWIEMSSSFPMVFAFSSPSMRREWIEIGDLGRLQFAFFVSLHAEGVD